MKTILLRALVTMLLLAPTALFSQNLPTVAVNDTVYMCGSTVTIYVQSNDTNPDGDSLTLSIYAGSVNGSFTINGNAIDYTPNVGFVGTDTLVYVVCDDGTPELCDTAFVFIHVYAFYIENNTATICNGDSVFLEGAYQTAPGLYTDFFTTIYGCDSIIITTLIVNPPTISTISADGPTTFCDGDSVTLTASPGTGWIWSTGDTTQSITVDSSGTYFVIVSDTNGCSASSALITVTESTTITASITPNGPTTFCEGDSVMLIASSGTSWLWSTGDTTQSITVDSSGTYSVTVNNGACTATASATVTVNPSPVATITPGGPTTFCEGGSVTLTASNGNSWLWSTGETSQEITADTSGFYSVTVTNANGCSDTATITVVIITVPVAAITPNGPTTFCTGDSVTLMASNGTSWTWSTGATTQNITVNTAGTYSVIVTTAGGCSDSAWITITVVPQPVATITPTGSTTFCQGDSVTLAASSGTTWVWSTGETTQNITVTTSGTYSVTVGNGSCTDSASVTINVNPLPVAAIVANGPTTFCAGDTVYLAATTGTSWSWSTGATAQTIAVTTSGNYWVTVTDNNGCFATSASTPVNVISAPVATVVADGSTTFCAGDSVTLTAMSGSSWLWSNGATTQSIAVYASGNYSVIVTDQCGSDTSSVTSVLVNSGPPVAGFSSSSNGYTYTFSNTSVAANSCAWNFGDNNTSSETNPVHTYSAPGSYLVILVVTNGCGSDTLTQLIDIGDPAELGFYTGFSPNGDGYNDYWNVPMLNYYAANTVTIINRWGNEVWKTDNYDNNNTVWTGKNLNGDELPDGTYYFIITYQGEEKRGWVFLKR